MARIVLVLVICTAVMFFVVLQTPPKFIQDALDEFASFSNESPEDAKEAEAKDPEAKPAAKTRKAATNGARRATTATPVPEVASTTTPVSSPSEPIYPLVFSVVTDGTALYSLNSTEGQVVGVLRKGEIVEPQLEIKDAGQTWAYVSVSGQRVSGFLRKDSLERQRLVQTLQ